MVRKNLLILTILLSLLLPSTLLFAASPPPETDHIIQTVTDEQAIHATVDAMEQAVLANDGDLYLSYVDLSDANFATEHQNWVRDWEDGEFLTSFILHVIDLEIEDDFAVGIMRLSWASTLEHQRGAVATYPVQFIYDADLESWLYAGEYWITTETENFLVHAAPGLEDTVDFLIPELPEIYHVATTSYDYEPQAAMEIKLYDSREALGANTLLSLPLITGWNEPAESLKLFATDNDFLAMVVAHEFTHFMTFDQAEHGQPLIPWWLNEGIAQYVAEPFDPRGAEFYFNNRILRVRTWLVDDEIVAWEEMSDFPSTPVELWSFVYPQGYTFVSFISSTYGEDLRNEWLHAQAVDMTIDEASEAILGLSFEDLNADFEDWLLDIR